MRSPEPTPSGAISLTLEEAQPGPHHIYHQHPDQLSYVIVNFVYFLLLYSCMSCHDELKIYCIVFVDNLWQQLDMEVMEHCNVTTDVIIEVQRYLSEQLIMNTRSFRILSESETFLSTPLQTWFNIFMYSRLISTLWKIVFQSRTVLKETKLSWPQHNKNV